MRPISILVGTLLLAGLLAACGHSQPAAGHRGHTTIRHTAMNPTHPTTASPAGSPATPLAAAPAGPPGVAPDAMAAANPLLAPWSGPHGGLPPFDRVHLEHFKPALEQAMALALAEVERIAGQGEPPTFDNTLASLERATRSLDRVRVVYEVWRGANKTPAFQAIELEMEPRLAALSDQITQNSALFRRIAAIYEQRERAGLSAEQQRLAWKIHDDFVRQGARLDSTAKARLAAINQQLAGLFTRFGQNVLADESEQFLLLGSEADLAGLPASFREAAAAAAEAKGLRGKWLIANTRSAVAPFLTLAKRRDLRKQAWQMFVERGDRGGKTDNNAIITEILALRAERAKLLGYPTHAHWRLEDSMAKTPQRAMELLEQVWRPAVARVHEEVADMQAVADREGAGIRIEPHDYRFYAEKVRREKYSFDDNLLKPYLQLEKLREALFWVAGELFGFEFRPLASVPVFHADVRVWEVVDKKSGRHVGVWYFDPFARAGKRSGAWMSGYRSQERLDRPLSPIVSNNANFLPAKQGQPVLISWDDARTMFHEFGHALHGLSSNVTYPSLSGTAVFRDYVEFPSQLLEYWLSTPEVLERFAIHYQTGQPIPKQLVERIERASTFNQGFDTVEYLASALIDMKLHLAGAQKIDPDVFERETLAALGMPKEIVMRHRTPQFLHIFSDDGYSAGYYSYLWADVLTADGYGAFAEAGGPYDRALADKLTRYVFSVGNTIDPGEGYRLFRGRDAKVDALLKKRGFPVGRPHY